MDYKLYTLVDITHTGQYRNEPGKEVARWQEQNFNTVLQTMGIRANVSFRNNPETVELAGNMIGFEFNHVQKVWRFDFYTDQDLVFELDGDPVGMLKQLFDAVPYIAGLSEEVEQNYNVFVTDGPNSNIVFYQK
jgi:hypothetical protein